MINKKEISKMNRTKKVAWQTAGKDNAKLVFGFVFFYFITAIQVRHENFLEKAGISALWSKFLHFSSFSRCAGLLDKISCFFVTCSSPASGRVSLTQTFKKRSFPFFFFLLFKVAFWHLNIFWYFVNYFAAPRLVVGAIYRHLGEKMKVCTFC